MSTKTSTGLVLGATAISVLAALLGALTGMIVGANIGGNWFTSFSIGSQHGYEATAMLGALIGGVALGGLALWLTLRHKAS